MKLPFIARRDAEIADLKRQLAEAAVRHEVTETKRRNLARWLAEADAANKRLNGRNRELSKRLDAAHDNQLAGFDEADRRDARIRRLLKVGKLLANALKTSERRGDLLQARLDDAVGLSSPALDWRPARSQQAKENAS